VIHPTAEVSPAARVGPGTRIWHNVHVREGAVIGEGCNLGNNVYIDSGVVIGNFVKIQNRVSVYQGVTIEDGVFIGPHATFTNDKYPRAITPDGRPLSRGQWQPLPTLVKYGASIGAGATVLPGVTIGRFAMVGANALVTSDVPDQALVTGVPARLVGYVCLCGRPLNPDEREGWTCPECRRSYAFGERS
jgi:acetyltransferase-like isoleucine patch superfamily enzyme